MWEHICMRNLVALLTSLDAAGLVPNDHVAHVETIGYTVICHLTIRKCVELLTFDYDHTLTHWVYIFLL